MISNTGEYALRAVAFLAGKTGTPMASAAIAEATKVPAGYMSKVLGSLARHQIVTTQRGPNGGCQLARAPEEISVFDVLLAVDPPKRIHTCPLGLPEHGEVLCPLHKRLDDVMKDAEEVFRNTTMAEVIREAEEDAACSFPLNIDTTKG